MLGCGVLLALFGGRTGYVQWQLQRAREALARSEFEAARRSLHAAERVDSDHAEVLFQLGRVHRRAGPYDEALPYLDRAEQAGWSLDEVEQQRYLYRMQMGDFRAAEPYLNRILRTGCTDVLAEEIYEARAKGYLRAYRLGDALLCLNFWIEWRPDAVPPRLWRAQIWEQLERWQTAGEDYQAVLEIDPNHALARRMLAGSLLNLHNVQQALSEYERCLASNADDVEALIGAAKCHRRLGSTEEAETRLRSVLRRELTDTQRAGVLIELGQILAERKQFSQAIECFQKASRADPRSAQAQSALASVYLKTGDDGRAARHQRNADEMQRRFQRLTEIMQELITDPADAELRWEAGTILMQDGRDEEGAAWMRTALACDAHHQKAHRALADYYAKTGNHQLAAHHRSRIAAP